MVDQYNPVPVSAAGQISSQFAKQIVVIVSLDMVYDMLHVTTYGSTPEHKESAALLGESVHRFIDAEFDENNKRYFEDFRFIDQGQRAMDIETCVSALDSIVRLTGESQETGIQAIRKIAAETLSKVNAKGD